jgi:D-sedoheptulose 7-phosphate isomerase
MEKKNFFKFIEKKNNQIISLFNNLKIDNNFLLLCEDSFAAINKGKKIIFFGNGGSAADAQHLATELTVRFKKNRIALPAISLSTDTSAITAIGNDFGFKYIFSRQLEAIGNSGDICIAITTSGNSENLLEAIKIAKKRKVKTYCFTGNKGGKIIKFIKNPIIIPSSITADIQVAEIFIGQLFCEILENLFLKKKLIKS